MKYNPDIHHRHSIRLKVYDYSQTGAYFVTICTQDRKYLFGDIVGGEMRLNDAGRMVNRIWNDLPVKYPGIEIDDFIVMPNHVHGIIVIHSVHVGAIHELPLRDETTNQDQKHRRQMLVPKIIGRFKMCTAKQINIDRDTQGTPVWQRNYYEHVIRDEDDLTRIWQYIIDNPIKWAEDEDNPVNIHPRICDLRRGNS